MELRRGIFRTPMMRQQEKETKGKLINGTALGNMIDASAGSEKGYAANFGKLLKGYLELRHFSAESFFNGPHLIEQLERIPAAFEVWPAHSHPFEQAFRRKFLLLSRWLVPIRGKLAWDLTHGLLAATGPVHFPGAPLGPLLPHGLVHPTLFGPRAP